MLKEKKNPGAWIVTPHDRGRKSIKDDKVYLNDGDVFQIELYNPLDISVLADVKLNGSSVSETGLVLRPAERVYLDCFINSKRKFVFKTYEVDNTEESMESISNNGLLEVFFYKEEITTLERNVKDLLNVFKEHHHHHYYPDYKPYTPYNPYPWQPSVWYSTGDINNSINTSGIIGVSNTDVNYVYNSTNLTGSLSCSTSLSSTSLSSNSLKNNSDKIETGRVEQGDISNQEFETVKMKFEKNYISSIVLYLLPESRKPIEKKDLDKGKLNESLGLLSKLEDLKQNGTINLDEFKILKEKIMKSIL